MSIQNDPECIRLNLGCGARPLLGYTNIDLDPLERLKARYPQADLPSSVEIHQHDIFNLPYEDGTVAEVRADSLLEHLSFLEEKRFFLEMRRVLMVGGFINLSVPDFEETARLWLQARDDWREFFRDDPEAIAASHWFGQYSYGMDSRWGYLTASIFGPQNGEGQFHKNCYTESKMTAILEYLGFCNIDVSRFRWKGGRDLMIRVLAEKRERSGGQSPENTNASGR